MIENFFRNFFRDFFFWIPPPTKLKRKGKGGGDCILTQSRDADAGCALGCGGGVATEQAGQDRKMFGLNILSHRPIARCTQNCQKSAAPV